MSDLQEKPRPAEASAEAAAPPADRSRGQEPADPAAAGDLRRCRLPARLAAPGEEWRGTVHRLGSDTARLLLAEGSADAPPAGSEVRLSFESERVPDVPGPQPLSARVVGRSRQTTDVRGRAAEEVELAWQQPIPEAEHAALHRLLAGLKPVLLMVGFPDAQWSDYTRGLHDVRVLRASDLDEALEVFSREAVAVCCVGPAPAPEESFRFLSDLVERFPGHGAQLIVTSGGDDLTLFLPLIDEDHLYYLTPSPIPADELRKILRAALVEGRPSAPQRRPDALLNRAIRDGQEVARHTDLVSLSLALQAAVLDLLHASHCHCLFYDPDTQTLISLGADGKESHRETATVGLASFVVRTGQSVLVDEVGREPRYDPDADTPEGDADMRFLGTPLVGPDGAPLGVVTALRPAAQPAFDETSKRVLEAFASQLGPVVSVRLDRWLRQSRGELMETETPEFSSHLFRKPAVEAFRQGERGEGDVLRLSPFWMTLTYRLLIGVLVVGLLFGFFARAKQYADGPAVVVLSDTTPLSATAAGTVAEVVVAPGDRVGEGEIVLRFFERSEAAELERIEAELETQLRRRLRDPSDPSIEQSLISLRAQRDLALSRLAQRSVRAPQAGTVGDVRVQRGQPVIPGQVLVTLASESREPRVVAFVPGRFRPELEPGQTLYFTVNGYPYSQVALEIANVGREIVGPMEAQRILGTTTGDAVDLQGPVVPVFARLTVTHFEAGAEELPYHSGLWGTAEIPIRSQRLLSTFLPFLETVFGGSGD